MTGGRTRAARCPECGIKLAETKALLGVCEPCRQDMGFKTESSVTYPEKRPQALPEVSLTLLDVAKAMERHEQAREA